MLHSLYPRCLGGEKGYAAPNKTNPGGRGGLGIDDGLWIIDYLGQGNGCRRSRAIPTPGAPNKANLAGHGRQTRNPKFEARNKPRIRMPQTARAEGVDRMRNKPNHPICCFLRRTAHYILETLQWLAGDSRENKANLRGRGPRLGIADLGLGIRGRGIRTDHVGGMQNKGNLELGDCRVAVLLAMTRMPEGARIVWTECKTKPICHFWLHRRWLWAGSGWWREVGGLPIMARLWSLRRIKND
jgi:hypothetical protein